jgi:PEP-CTERM motif-containing protein
MNAAVSTVLAGISVVLLSAGQALAGAVQIPEPSSFALIAAGAAAVAWAKFRRRG